MKANQTIKKFELKNRPGRIKFSSVVLMGVTTAVAIGIIVGIQNLEKGYQEQQEEVKKENDRLFEQTLENIQTDAENGRYNAALDSLKEFPVEKLTEDKQAQWHFAMGDVYSYASLTESKVSALQWNLAQKHFQEYLRLTPNPEERNKAYRKLIKLYKRKDDWTNVNSMLIRINPDVLDSIAYGQYNLDKAEAMWNLENEKTALNYLSKIQGTSDDVDIWSKAMVMHANYLLDIIEDDKRMKKFSSEKFDMKEQMWAQADEIYRRVIEDTDNQHENNCIAKLGLVRVLLMVKKFDEAYKHVNSIQLGLSLQVVFCQFFVHRTIICNPSVPTGYLPLGKERKLFLLDLHQVLLLISGGVSQRGEGGAMLVFQYNIL